jgi:hypothetical protein
MVLPGARLMPVGMLPLAMKESSVEGTIGTSRGKTRWKSPFLACQQSVFFALARYRVDKIARSYFEVVLWTTKHIIVYPSSGLSFEVIVLHPAVWYWRWTIITMGVSRELEKFTKWMGKYSCASCLKGRGPFIDREAVE